MLVESPQGHLGDHVGLVLGAAPAHQHQAAAVALGDAVVSALLGALIIGTAYFAVWQAAPVRWPVDDWRTWVAGFVLVEFAYYWMHRWSHTIRWMWATHAVHHSPNELTLLAAVRLGWSKGDQEYFTDAEMAAAFDLKGLGKAPARLDFDKMSSVNAWHMKRAEDARLTDLLWDRLQGRDDLRLDDQAKVWVSSAMKVLKERAATLAELEDQTYFLIRPRPIELTGKSAKAINDDARARLSRLADVLRDTPDWTEAALGDVLNAFAEAEEVGFGKVGQPLRAALTGGAPAPSGEEHCGAGRELHTPK